MGIQLVNSFEHSHIAWVCALNDISLLEVEHEGGSNDESSIEIEDDDLFAELLYHIVGVGPHQNITKHNLGKFEIACCSIFYHQRWQRCNRYLQREWDHIG